MHDENAKLAGDQADVTMQPSALACPVCGGRLFDIRAKLQCSQCHRICESCCEGGRG